MVRDFKTHLFPIHRRAYRFLYRWLSISRAASHDMERARKLTEQNWERLQIQERDHVEFCEAFPELVELELTRACNYTCTHCGTHGLPGDHLTNNSAAPMDMKLLDKLAQEVFPYCRRVSVIGRGEPFMTPRKLLRQFFKYLEITHTFFDFATNGALIDQSLINSMLPVLGNICFSLDAAKPDTYFAIKRSDKFHYVVNIIKILLKLRDAIPADRHRFQLLLCFALRRANHGELIDFLKMAADLGVDGVYVLHLLVHFPGMQSETLIGKPDIANPILELASKEAEELKLAVFLPAPIDNRPLNKSRQKNSISKPVTASRINCCFLWRSIIIRNDGQVFPCSSLHSPYIGNVKKDSFFRIWNSEKIRQMRIRLDTADPHPACRRCWFREVSYFESLANEDDFALKNVQRSDQKAYNSTAFSSYPRSGNTANSI